MYKKGTRLFAFFQSESKFLQGSLQLFLDSFCRNTNDFSRFLIGLPLPVTEIKYQPRSLGHRL